MCKCDNLKISTLAYLSYLYINLIFFSENFSTISKIYFTQNQLIKKYF